jgi:hypothetical protein
MLKFIALLFTLASCHTSFSQTENSPKANYQLASRFSSKKLEKMVFSTSVDPHWLKLSDRFWYVYETPQGRQWYIVDPSKGNKRVMFDNEKLAAELTKIVRDPFDAQHLTIFHAHFYF